MRLVFHRQGLVSNNIRWQFHNRQREWRENHAHDQGSPFFVSILSISLLVCRYVICHKSIEIPACLWIWRDGHRRRNEHQHFCTIRISLGPLSWITPIPWYSIPLSHFPTPSFFSSRSLIQSTLSYPLCPLVDYQETPEHLSPTLHPQDILIQNSINHGCEVGGIWNRLEWDAMDQYSPSPRTLTCSFSEYKIYPGHGGMYIRKDGQVGVVRVSVITSPCVTWTRSAALWTSRRRDPLAFAGRLLGDVTTRSRR